MIEIGKDLHAIVICDVCRKPIKGKDNGNVIWSDLDDRQGADYLIVHSGRGSAPSCDFRPRGIYKYWMSLESFFKHDLLPTLK